MKKLTIILSLVLTANLALAQGFYLISTDPAEGAVNVPQSATISFTFDAPLDTTWQFGDDDEGLMPIAVLGPEPEDSVEVIEWWVSPDLTTISIQVEHYMEGNIFWLVMLAYNDIGEPLTEPVCLHYSTSGTMGPWTVSGTIDAGELDPTYTAVGLMEIPLFSDDEGGCLYAGTLVPDDSGEYTIPYVSNGIWWPVAAYDLNGDGDIDPESGDLLGFWDPDEDMQPDSLVVEDGNLTGIDMTLLDFFEVVTVHEYLPQAWELAEEWADDQELRMIGAGTDIINLDGTAPAWGYLFWSPAGEFFTNIMIMSMFSQVDTTSEIGFPNDMLPIPADFLDSDEAMTIASDNGALEFEQEYDLIERWLHGGNFYWAYPEHEEETVWMVGCLGIDPDSGEEVGLHIAMDIVTGEIVQIDWEDVNDPPAGQLPRNFELHPNHPNPFNPVTTISYELSAPAEVELVVYNIKGHAVSTLVEGPQTAGLHTLQFDGSDLPSGIYFYQLNTCEDRLPTRRFSQTRRMLLVK